MRRVEYLRRKMGLKQYRLALELGLNPATMNRIEQGPVNPERTSPRIAKAIEGFFGMTLQELLEEV